MFALITFIIGLVILFKGTFRFRGRMITKPQSRTIGLILMAPIVIEFCMSFVLVSNNFQITPDGTVSFTNDALDYVGGTLQTADGILVILAVGIVAFTIYNAAKVGDAAPAAVQQIGGAQRVPDIMTVAEAAAYMRVTEREVLGLIDQGKLGAARIGDTYRIARIAIEDFMAHGA